MATKGQLIKTATDSLKDPYVLDFLGLPESKQFHESKLESAIIENLQLFLLELGKGFAFIARQCYGRSKTPAKWPVKKSRISYAGQTDSTLPQISWRRSFTVGQYST